MPQYYNKTILCLIIGECALPPPPLPSWPKFHFHAVFGKKSGKKSLGWRPRVIMDLPLLILYSSDEKLLMSATFSMYAIRLCCFSLHRLYQVPLDPQQQKFRDLPLDFLDSLQFQWIARKIRNSTKSQDISAINNCRHINLLLEKSGFHEYNK